MNRHTKWLRHPGKFTIRKMFFAVLLLPTVCFSQDYTTKDFLDQIDDSSVGFKDQGTMAIGTAYRSAIVGFHRGLLFRGEKAEQLPDHLREACIVTMAGDNHGHALRFRAWLLDNEKWLDTPLFASIPAFAEWRCVEAMTEAAKNPPELND